MNSNFREIDEFFDVGALRVMYMLHHPGGLSIPMNIVKILSSYMHGSYPALRCTIAIRHLELDLASLIVRHLDN